MPQCFWNVLISCHPVHFSFISFETMLLGASRFGIVLSSWLFLSHLFQLAIIVPRINLIGYDTATLLSFLSHL